LLTEAPLLVFDEPTSALDPQHEALITQTLSSLKGQRTIVLVSHRLSTVVDCDEIFVMEDGRIAERGNHMQLLALARLIPRDGPASVYNWKSPRRLCRNDWPLSGVPGVEENEFANTK